MKKSTEQFIKDSIRTHKDKYDYSLVVYDNAKTKVKIICPIHGTFEQIPNNHIRGAGCKKCAVHTQSNNQRLTLPQFITRSHEVHSNRYDYSLVEYTNIDTKVKIICPIHGTFEQIPYIHLKGHGCYSCRAGKISHTKTKSKEKFIIDATRIHGDRYDYSLVEYKGSDTKIDIICPVHGTFEQLPSNHLRFNNCPKCSNVGVSLQEQELQEWVSQYIEIETNNRSLIYPYELDIIIPSKKIAIEYNGLYWHSESAGKDQKYHLNKYNLCKEKGYRLIQIWENEWLLKKDIVKSILSSIIGIYERKIHGRKCEIRDVSSRDARIFYDSSHIQGFKGGKHKGLYYNNELVSLMTIDNTNELQRFANKTNTQVYGAFSKLLKSFEINGDLTTFSDLRYFTGDVYRNNGFEQVYTTKPNFYYFKGHDLQLHSRISFQKYKLQQKLESYDPDLTAYQNMLNNDYHRIWDCGNMKFVMVV